jgi:hypothetical protein
LAAIMGRPKIAINWDTFEELCNIQCTAGEIASVMRISVDTLTRRTEEHYGTTFAETYNKYIEGGKACIRRMQFKLAKTNVGMAIWLGKQYLNQKDNLALTHASPEVIGHFERVMSQLAEQQRLHLDADKAIDVKQIDSDKR